MSSLTSSKNVPAHATDHPHTLAEVEGVFGNTEWKSLHGQDYRAAKIIVSLMVAIFGTGLLMYMFICLQAAR
ncbi:MAG: hypothetical protein HY040_15300 [Planctomycetes bacterium]|nr:hypothetical protein [Planctomycetota bacterium]